MKNLLLIILLVSNYAIGQNYVHITPRAHNDLERGNNFNSNNTLGNTFSSNIFESRPLAYEIKGSPYSTDVYQKGTTTLHEKKGFDYEMRYNAGKDVIEFLDDDNQIKELLRRPYITARFGGFDYEIMEYIDQNEEKLGYFNPLNKGIAQLLLKPDRNLVRIGMFQGKRMMKYQDASVYYLKKKGHSAVPVKLNKKDILNQLSTHTNDLNAFIENYNLNLKKEEDVIHLLDYYNSLLSSKSNKKEIRS